MKKTDAIISAVIGFLIGGFFIIIFKVIGLEVPFLPLFPFVFLILCLFAMLIASALKAKILILYQAVKFVLVGALNTFVDLGVLNLLMWTSGITAGIYYSAFKGISFLAASTNSYFWNKHWTFAKKDKIFVLKEFLGFLVVVAVGFCINVGVASVVVNIIGPQYGLSKEIWANIGAFVAVFFAFVWNFIGSKFIVFKK